MSGHGLLGTTAVTATVGLVTTVQAGGTVCIANGTDDTAGGYLKVCSDAYGSWSSDAFGGAGPGDPDWGDEFKPEGDLDLREVSFASGTFLFRPEAGQRELLSDIVEWQNIFAPDASLAREVLSGSVAFDDNGDGTSDRLESSFRVFGAAFDVSVDLTQQISLFDSCCIAGVLAQTYAITNNRDTPVEFVLLRHIDANLTWDLSADLANDAVATGQQTFGPPPFVFQWEEEMPTTAVMLGGMNPDIYYGAKNGIDPDGDGPGPAMGLGTDQQQWDAYGVPVGWENFIAGVGANLDGTSGPSPAGCTEPCDGSIGLSAPVVLEAAPGPGSTTIVLFEITYGTDIPTIWCDEGPPCIWDCADLDGNVGVTDFLQLLAEWGLIDTPCDFDGNGVDILDFLELLAHWGPCC